MKIDYVEEGSCLRRLNIEVPEQEVTSAFEQEADRLSRSLKLPGFRKGRIPKDLVKNRFRAEILSQVARELVPEALNRALSERSLTPIGEPRVDQVDMDAGRPLRFRASFEIMPQIEVQGYKNLEVVERSAEVTDEDVDKHLEALRDRAAEFHPVEGRGAREGDLARGNLHEQVEEGRGPTRTREGVLIEVGSGSYHPALHEALDGAGPGDQVTAKASFAADHPDPDRAGKTFDVRFELLELKEKLLPQMDDELAKDLGEFESLAELRAHVREQVQLEARRQAEQDLRRQLLDKLVEANAFDAPETLVEQEMDRRVEEAARSLIDRGLDPRRAAVDWQALREEQRDASRRSVQASILLDRIVAQENLWETQEDVDAEIKRIASELKRGVEAVRAQLMKEGALERLRQRLRREKAVDLLRQNARIQRS